MIEALAISGLVGLGLLVADIAKRFSHTSHGDNPWTYEAFFNVLTRCGDMMHAVNLLGGSINDAYRSPQVNAAVGGVQNSYHQLGLAIDIAPGNGYSPETGARAMYAAAVKGELGPARTVIWEPGWVHLDWHNPKDIGPPPPVRFFKKLASGKYEPVKP